MNSTLSLSASGPSAFSASDISHSVVGQTSGQWVKPKKTANGSPFRSESESFVPDCVVSVNGPPILAEATDTKSLPPAAKAQTTMATRSATAASVAEMASLRRHTLASAAMTVMPRLAAHRIDGEFDVDSAGLLEG